MTWPAKKSLGQHFLLNPSTIDRILEKAEVGPDDAILEIGPGPGRMTERLIQEAKRVVAIEKDHRFASMLKERFNGNENITVIEADVLEVDLPRLLSSRDSGPWKAVANLPYNIATEVIFRMIEAGSTFSSLFLMVQREVAERFVARPGSKHYGIPSILTQIFSENRIVMRLGPGAFTPPPKVHSALVAFRIHESCRFAINDLKTFKDVVRAAFGKRRKTISNALRDLKRVPQTILDALEAARIPPSARAEQISIEQFVALANRFGQVPRQNTLP